MPSAVKAPSPNHRFAREFPNATHYLVYLGSVHVRIKKTNTDLYYIQSKKKTNTETKYLYLQNAEDRENVKSDYEVVIIKIQIMGNSTKQHLFPRQRFAKVGGGRGAREAKEKQKWRPTH